MAKYLGEYSNKYNEIIKENRDENFLIEKANITLDIHHSNGVETNVQLKDVECVEYEGEKGFVTYLGKGDIYMFYPESEITNIEPLGKHVKFMRSDLKKMTLDDYHNAIYNSRNEKKENTVISFIPTFAFQKIEKATLIDTDELKGCVFQNNGFKFFAPMSAISEIIDTNQITNYTSNELLEIKRKEDEKIALSKYFEIKKYFDKNNITITNFPNIDSFTESPNLNLLQSVSNIKSIHERYINQIGMNLDIPKDMSAEKLYTNIKKQFIENEFSKNISDFQEQYGFTVEFNFPVLKDVVEISIKSRNGEELSQCTVNLQFMIDEDGDDCEAVVPIVMQHDIENYEEEELPLISENGKTIFDYKESKFASVYKLLDRICFEHSICDELSFVKYDIESEPDVEEVYCNLSNPKEAINFMIKKMKEVPPSEIPDVFNMKTTSKPKRDV